MVKVGEHITIDFLGVKKDYSPEFYEKVIYKIAKAAKVEILNVASHKFEPQGFTLVALLSESHFSFHTFPERGVISFDFFTCGKINPKVALKILRNEIDHKRVVTNAFDRSSIGLYDDIYSTPGQKKFYVVKDVLEKFTSKVGQFVEVMDLEEFGNALFIDHEIQVAEKDEKIYSSNFFKFSPNATWPWLAIKHADLFLRALIIFLERFLVPKVAYLLHLMSSPPATATI